MRVYVNASGLDALKGCMIYIVIVSFMNQPRVNVLSAVAKMPSLHNSPTVDNLILVIILSFTRIHLTISELERSITALASSLNRNKHQYPSWSKKAHSRSAWDRKCYSI